MSFYRRYGKRLFDLAVATPALAAASPMLLALSGLVRWRLGSPVLFTQPRPGENERIFTILKFRTMTDATDEHGELLPDDQRLTPFGKFLRASSLDELPELINVIKGDMSLVGPRPLLVQYLPLYSPAQRARHDVRPGLTGWAQINGRNTTTWEQRFEHDLYYVEHCSFILDLRILATTVLHTLTRHGINHPGHATMPPFTGTAANDAPKGKAS